METNVLKTLPDRLGLYMSPKLTKALRFVAFAESTVTDKRRSVSGLVEKLVIEALPSYVESMLYNHKENLDDETKNKLAKTMEGIRNDA